MEDTPKEDDTSAEMVNVKYVAGKHASVRCGSLHTSDCNLMFWHTPRANSFAFAYIFRHPDPYLCMNPSIVASMQPPMHPPMHTLSYGSLLSTKGPMS